jgi:tellurite resistance-related uncharacterized protein
MTAAKIATTLPPGLERYSSSPEFTSATVPQSLLAEHKTKRGVWGLLRVQRGRLFYCLDCHPPEKLLVAPGGAAVIDPEVPHHVEVLDADTAFLIEFHRAAGAP